MLLWKDFSINRIGQKHLVGENILYGILTTLA